MSLTLEEWASAANIVGAVIAISALIYTAIQVHGNNKTSRAQFWLNLRSMFAEHREVHLKLRNSEWSKDLPSDDDWEKLEAYMGLFEHCEIMLGERLLDWNTFKAIYGYRVQNLVDDALVVREKLIDRRSGWRVFILLLQRMTGDLPRKRYLSGYWDVDNKKWKLWWGFVELEEGSATHNTFDELKNGYESKLKELKTRVDGVAHAWLMTKEAVVSEWHKEDTE